MEMKPRIKSGNCPGGLKGASMCVCVCGCVCCVCVCLRLKLNLLKRSEDRWKLGFDERLFEFRIRNAKFLMLSKYCA